MMNKVNFLIFINSLLIFIDNLNLVQSNKVIELSDKFLDVYNRTSKAWLIKFFSHSCHQCKKLGK